MILETIPKKGIKLLNQLLLRYPNIIDSILSTGTEQSNTVIDMNTATFHGPFITYREEVIIEQQQIDKPQFHLSWILEDPYYLYFEFSDFFNVPTFSIYIDTPYVNIQNELTKFFVIRHMITPEGNLGVKTN